MSMMQFFQNLRDGFHLGYQHVQFRQLMEMDRGDACEGLARLVVTMEAEALDRFEAEFLTHSIAVIGNDHRLRAMELYAFLKLQETRQYGKFRGFVTDGAPLAS